VKLKNLPIPSPKDLKPKIKKYWVAAYIEEGTDDPDTDIAIFNTKPTDDELAGAGDWQLVSLVEVTL